MVFVIEERIIIFNIFETIDLNDNNLKKKLRNKESLIEKRL